MTRFAVLFHPCSNRRRNQQLLDPKSFRDGAAALQEPFRIGLSTRQPPRDPTGTDFSLGLLALAFRPSPEVHARREFAQWSEESVESFALQGSSETAETFVRARPQPQLESQLRQDSNRNWRCSARLKLPHL